MKKLSKLPIRRILAAGLILLLSMSVVACSGGDVPVAQGVPTAPLAAPAQIAAAVSDVAAVSETNDTVYAGFLSAMTAFNDIKAQDTSMIMTIGLDELPPMTFERMLSLLEAYIAADINATQPPDFMALLEEYSLQIKAAMSLDENFNFAYKLGIPMESGEFLYLFDVILVDGVLYTAMGLPELVDSVMPMATDLMTAQGMSNLEINMITLLIGDILGRFDGVDYVATDLSAIPELAELVEMFNFSPQMFERAYGFQTEILSVAEDFEQAHAEELAALNEAFESLLSKDGDWYVLSADEAQVRELLELSIEFMGENADTTADFFNQIIDMYMDVFEFDLLDSFAVTADELNEAVAQFDPSFFDEFAAQFEMRVRADERSQESVMTGTFTVVDDFSLWISLEMQVSPRTAPITAPDGAITLEEFLEILTEIAEDYDFADELDGALDAFIEGFMEEFAGSMQAVANPIAFGTMPEVSRQLLGVWSWDADSGYLYTFDLHFLGTRGFAGSIEFFEWYAFEEDGEQMLIIAVDGSSFYEHWMFSIDNNILTIDSAQVPGLTFSYNRVG